MTAVNPIFIDFEASSLDLIASYPIEVGICMPNGDTHSWLIKPHVLWKDWSGKAAKIHGISRDELEKNGQDCDQVAQELNELLGDHFVYCDAWTFDSFWLHRLFKASGIKHSFQIESISALLDADQVSKWQDVHNQAINDMDLLRHRASNDALILHETFKRLIQS
ncbi:MULTISPECIES: exonuclease domain-containing protein [unclassified Oleiphilus]|uniref:3'-5' exonuclease n=1 Tax=unclassified Oleiphilus TaxID=2631174 RepID=UPI000B27FED4|nr:MULTISPECIES: exonuclease domain-containing protein [unclassified Oleiphilus]